MEELARGNYLLFLYRFTILEHTTTQVRHIEDCLMIVATLDGECRWDDGGALLSVIVESAEGDRPTDDVPDIVAKCKDRSRNEVQRRAEQVLSEYERISSAARNSKKNSLSKQVASKIAKIKKDMSYVHDQRARESRQAQIERLKTQLEGKLKELDACDLRISGKCTGIIYVMNKG